MLQALDLPDILNFEQWNQCTQQELELICTIICDDRYGGIKSWKWWMKSSTISAASVSVIYVVKESSISIWTVGLLHWNLKLHGERSVRSFNKKYIQRSQTSQKILCTTTRRIFYVCCFTCHICYKKDTTNIVSCTS